MTGLIGWVLTLWRSTPFSGHRKTNHQTANARTMRKDITNGKRGDGKALEERRHCLKDLWSSGTGIETLGRMSSLSCWGKALSVDLSCLLMFSSPCTNRARSCVCFHGRRSRKTEKDEQNDRWKMLKNETWGCAKDLGRSFGHPILLYFGNLPQQRFYNNSTPCTIFFFLMNGH